MTIAQAPTTPQSKESTEQATTWTELVKIVDTCDGIALVPMETLRKLEGAQRLGVHVLNSIGSRLNRLGLGFLPDTLPNRQDRDAILYRVGTPASELVTAVHSGLKTQSDVVHIYKLLHKLNTLPDTSQVVRKDELDEKLTEATRTLVDLLGKTGRTDVMNDMLGSL